MSGEERDAFQLRPVLYPALPVDASINPDSPAALNRSIRCAEPFGSHFYIGSSDGQVHCYIQPNSKGAQEAEEFRHVGTRDISSKPVDKIVILSRLAIAAVLSEATLTFHELPSFLPIPPQVLPHTKGVSLVVLDDEEVSDSFGEDRLGGVDGEGLANLCVVKRKAMMLVKVGVDTWRVIKEIPLPGGATSARRSGSFLCLSTTTEYKVVNLQAATMADIGLPISQAGDAPSASNRPSIVSIASRQAGRCEFVITSHSQDSTLGVFVSQEGDPTAKLLEWPSHPRALALDYPFLHALLRNDSIEIHNVVTMEKVQTLHLPQLLEPRSLSLATSTLLVMEAGQAQMDLVSTRLDEGGRRTTVSAAAPSGKEGALKERRTRSRVLLVGKNAVQCLCTSRSLDTAKKALQRGDFERLKRIVDSVSIRDDDAIELDYMNQMLAIYCIRMLQFKEARRYILQGHMDPRLVLHLFPTLLKGAYRSDATVEVFADVQNGLTELGDLERFPSHNLELNYCPPLDVDKDEVLRQLLGKLTKRIHHLLRSLLDDYRGQESMATRRELDTCLAKVMIVQEDKQALAQLLKQSNECDLALLEPHLAAMGCYAALVQIKQGEGDWKAAFDLQTKLLDGELEDATFEGSMQDMVQQLEQCPDAELVHQYALWLIQRDAEAGIKLLGKPSTSRSNQTTLEELRAIDEKAADAFLENTALSRRQHTAEAHMELAHLLFTRLSKALREEKERKLMDQVFEEYIEGEYAESFVAHMALRWDQTKTIAQRLKLIMLLQGSQVLDVEKVLGWVQREPVLVFEEAILLGKLRRDADALELLAIKLRDANSSEIYCNQNRFALSSVQMHSLAVDQKDLVLYANFYAKSLKRAAAAGGGRGSETMIKLLKTLLQVYMEKGEGNETQVATSHLLNTQSINLSPLEVLSLVPPQWSLSTLETFLSRSLRKEMHMSNEGQIKRSVALAQNLQVAESLWAKRRGLGGVIEDGTEGDDEESGQLGGTAEPALVSEVDEGQVLLEKAEKAEGAGVDEVGLAE